MEQGLTERVEISTEFIRLDAFLKYTGVCGTGGMAKQMIQDGMVLVNGAVCTQRGKKLRSGDAAQLSGEGNKTYEIV